MSHNSNTAAADHGGGPGSLILIEDIFDVKDVDQGGRKFDRVSRIQCSSENYEMDLVLDINRDIYPIEVGERITVALARTLELDGRADDGKFDPSMHPQEMADGTQDPGRPSLMDGYDYVMHGRVYDYRPVPEKRDRVALYASFGGLLMKLTGDPHNMDTVFPAQTDDGHRKGADTHLYILIRK